MKGFAFILTFATLSAIAQTNQSCKWVTQFSVPVELDSLSVVPGSFTLSAHTTVEFDVNTNRIMLLKPGAGMDSVRVCYSRFPFKLTAVYRNREEAVNPLIGVPAKRSSAMGQKSSLIKSGILSRGVTMGNTRDMALTSRMDFRLEGAITDNLKLEATIFDQNIPFQPEGNTNSLKNFDRLNIRIYNDQVSVEAGDIYLRSRKGEFLNYSRGVMGAGMSWSDSTQSLQIRTGVNKGRFHSASINGTDGISGPYKISGPVNDPFVIILAGSERVYLDGVLMNRGLDEDYEIDYNLGEINFTAKHVLTRHSRIRIDFEFMNRTFQRSSKSLDYEKNSEKLRFYLNYFGEKDNPFLSSGITDLDLEQMSMSGNGSLETFDATEVDFQAGRVSYIKTDSLGYSDVFIRSTDSDRQHYDVRFRYVGKGMGDYERDYQEVNDGVYFWVSPEDGESQGSYSPTRNLKAPTRLDVISGGAEIKISEFEAIRTELAFSSFSENILAEAPGRSGLALLTGINSAGRPLRKSQYTWDYGLTFQRIGKDFTAVDPFRTVDFDRHWGIDLLVDTDQLLEGYAKLTDEKENSVSLTSQFRKIGSTFQGKNLTAVVDHGSDFLQVSGHSYFMNGTLADMSSVWRKHRWSVSSTSRKLAPAYQYRSEFNSSSIPGLAEVSSSLQNFDEHRFLVKSEGQKGWKFDSYYSVRRDLKPENGEFISDTRAEIWHSGLKIEGESNRFESGITKSKLSDQSKSTSVLQGNLLGNLTMFQGSLKSRIRAETSSSWEPRREFIYRQVPAGQGHYAWRDLNADGVQQMSEFFEAVHLDEQNYARFFINGTERIPAYLTRINAQMMLRFPRTSPVFWRKFSAMVRLTSRGKTLQEKHRLSGIGEGLENDQIVSGRRGFNYRLVAKDLLDILTFEQGLRTTAIKDWVLNGYELRGTRMRYFLAGIQINSESEVQLKATNTQRDNASDVLTGRNYNFHKNSYSANLRWSPKPEFGSGIGYSYSLADGNEGDDSISGSSHILTSTLQWVPKAKTTLKSDLEFALIDYGGNPNSALGYDIMDAFVPGNNFRWILNFQQELNSGLMINLMYLTRKSANSKMVQRASVQISARF